MGRTRRGLEAEAGWFRAALACGSIDFVFTCLQPIRQDLKRCQCRSCRYDQVGPGYVNQLSDGQNWAIFIDEVIGSIDHALLKGFSSTCRCIRKVSLLYVHAFKHLESHYATSI